MKDWKFWDWMSVATTGIAVLFPAIAEGIKKLPVEYVPQFLSLWPFSFVPLLLFISAILSWGIRALTLSRGSNKQVEPVVGRGGDGGTGIAVGPGATVIGGRGGDGGVGGTGGDGGGGIASGENARVIGGDGGNAGMADGRGGRPPRHPAEVSGGPSVMWGYGRGGAGANAPEYDRRITLLTKIRQEYLDRFPADAVYVHAGVDLVPVAWMNKRLEELGEVWRVTVAQEQGYVLPPLR